MNWLAFFDALLALTAGYVGWRPARAAPALRLGCWILASAAVLGSLRFSGLLPWPALHQYLSMLGAAVGLPLLAVAVVGPSHALAARQRYTGAFAIGAAVVCTLLVEVAQFKVWSSACALAAGLAILACGVLRRQALVAAAGVLMLAALAAFAGKLQAGVFQPGDFLHIGLALALVLLGRWAIGQRTATTR